MTYLTGTLTDANAPATLYGTIATALAANGYVLHDTVVIATATHKVWKNPAANNPTGKDWYMIISYTTSGGGFIWFWLCELFDATTDLVYRGPVNSWVTSGYVPEGVFYSKHGATGYALNSTNWHPSPNATNSQNGNYILAPATSFGYWLSITPSRIVAMASGEVTTMIYSGAYTPSASHAAAAGTDVFPLVVARMGPAAANSDISSGLTRVPKATFNVGSQFPLINSAFPASQPTPRMPSGDGGSTVFAYKEVQKALVMGNGAAISGIFGELIDYGFLDVDSTVTRGDTVTDGSIVWTLSSASGNRALAMKQI